MNRTHLRDFRLWIVVSLLLALFGVPITDSTRLTPRAIRPGLNKQLDGYHGNHQALRNVRFADGKQDSEMKDNEKGYEMEDNEQGYKMEDNEKGYEFPGSEKGYEMEDNKQDNKQGYKMEDNEKGYEMEGSDKGYEQGYEMEDNESSNGDNPMMADDSDRGKDDEEEEEEEEEEGAETSRKREAVGEELDVAYGRDADNEEESGLDENEEESGLDEKVEEEASQEEDNGEARSEDESVNAVDTRDNVDGSSDNAEGEYDAKQKPRIKYKRDKSTRLKDKTVSESAATNEGPRSDVQTPLNSRCKWHVSNHEWVKMSEQPEQEVDYDVTLTDEAHMGRADARATSSDKLALEKRNSPVRFMPLRFPKRRHSHEPGETKMAAPKRCDTCGNKTGDKDKPGTSDTKPGTCDNKPDKKCGTCDNKPGTCDNKPGTCDNKPGTCDKKPGTCDKKPGTCNNKPGTCDSKPGTCNQKPGTCNNKPGTCDNKPGTCDNKPGTCGKKNVTCEKENEKEKECCDKAEGQDKCNDEKPKCHLPKTKAKDYCAHKEYQKEKGKGKAKPTEEGSKTYKLNKWHPEKRARDRDPRVSKRKEEEEGEKEGNSKDDYGYGPTNGPSTWTDKYPDCGGDRQSPINLVTSTTCVEYEPLVKWKNYETLPCRAKLTNNGKSVMFIPVYDGPPPFIYDSVSKQEYVFGQLHFHWGADNKHGSEHTVNFKQYAMEMQCVHYRRELGGLEKASQVPGGLTIIGVLFQVGKYNPGLRNIQWSFTKVRTAPKSSLVAPFPLSHLIRPFSKHFLTYNGSFTTPPCTESVRWIIDQKISHLSKTQLNQFRRFKNADGERLLHNFRPLQPLNCRQVIQAA